MKQFVIKVNDESYIMAADEEHEMIETVGEAGAAQKFNTRKDANCFIKMLKRIYPYKYSVEQANI